MNSLYKLCIIIVFAILLIGCESKEVTLQTRVVYIYDLNDDYYQGDSIRQYSDHFTVYIHDIEGGDSIVVYSKISRIHYRTVEKSVGWLQ
jgi:hypothetical protein